jgi:hypothetical protein
VSGPGDVPSWVLRGLREICLSLPETYEEPAWIGVRWRIRGRTFAHAATLDLDRNTPHPRAAPDQPMHVLTFRSPVEEMVALVEGGHPFYKPGWGTDVVGMVLEEGLDWTEMAELLTDSFCVLAPKRLAARAGPQHSTFDSGSGRTRD